MEVNLCKHTRLATNCPVCEFEAKPKQTAIEFLDSLPLEFPDEFPQYWAARNGDWRAKARLDRVLLTESEETHKFVSEEGMLNTYNLHSPFIPANEMYKIAGERIELLTLQNPYERIETVRDIDESE